MRTEHTDGIKPRRSESRQFRVESTGGAMTGVYARTSHRRSGSGPRHRGVEVGTRTASSYALPGGAVATIEELDTGRRVVLAAIFQLGRAPSADLHLDADNVSSAHAQFSWARDTWRIRDLGSSNGTAVDGERLRPGMDRALRVGCVLQFGSKRQSWRVVDLEPPRPMLVGERGEIAWVDSGSLALPDTHDPDVFLLRDSRGCWWLQTTDHERQVTDGTAFLVRGKVWKPYLNRDARATAKETEEEVRLHFRVSRGEEHIEIDVEVGSTQMTLASRAHTFLLLTLARLRLGDRTRGIPEGECGWTATDDLCQMLRMTRPAAYTQVYRARRQLETAGHDALAERIVQHRRTSGEIRFGFDDVQVTVV